MSVRIIVGDAREKLRGLPSGSAQCGVCSPPYLGLRDYGVAGQIGLEDTPDAYIAELVAVFRELRRVLAGDGTLWLNLGDSYAGSWGAQSRGEAPGPASKLSGGQVYAAPRGTHTGSLKNTPGLKPKDRMMMPARVALALQADGWWLRDEIVWAKPNAMPSSVDDRTTMAHEMLYLLSKSARYYFDSQAFAEPAISDHASGNGFAGRQGGAEHMPMSGGQGTVEEWRPGGTRNRRSVWTVATASFAEAHFATFPPALIEPCILAGSRKGDMVIDPFGGAGTTALVADRLGRDCTLIELNPAYAEMARKRISGDAGMFSDIEVAA